MSELTRESDIKIHIYGVSAIRLFVDLERILYAKFIVDQEASRSYLTNQLIFLT